MTAARIGSHLKALPRLLAIRGHAVPPLSRIYAKMLGDATGAVRVYRYPDPGVIRSGIKNGERVVGGLSENNVSACNGEKAHQRE